MSVPIFSKLSNPVASSQHDSPPKLNGFTLAADGKSAIKDVKLQGIKLKFVVSLADCKSPEDQQKRLASFSSEKIRKAASLAIGLGLGKEKELKQVSFEHTAESNLLTATKHYADQKTNKVDSKYFNTLEKLLSERGDKPGLKRLIKQKKLYEKTVQAWNKQGKLDKKAESMVTASTKMYSENIKKQVTSQMPKQERVSKPFPPLPPLPSKADSSQQEKIAGTVSKEAEKPSTLLGAEEAKKFHAFEEELLALDLQTTGEIENPTGKILTQVDQSEINKEETLPPSDKKKAISEEDQAIFKKFAKLLEELNDENKGLTLKSNGTIEIAKRRILSLGSFFNQGRSKSSQAALSKILATIDSTLRSGYDPLIPNDSGEPLDIRKLYNNFIQSSYGEKLIMNSPSMAHMIVNHSLAKINENDPEMGKKLEGQFTRLTASDEYDGKAILQFIKDLPFSVAIAQYKNSTDSTSSAHLSQPTTLNFNPVPLTSQLDQVINELITTEKSYLKNIHLLLSHSSENNVFQQLLDHKVISEEEHAILTQGWQELAKQSESLIGQLEAMQKSSANPLEALATIFSASNLEDYIKSTGILVIKNIQLNRLITKISGTAEGKNILQGFENKPPYVNLGSIFIGPVQRLPRLEMLMKEVSKRSGDQNLREAQAVAALETNIKTQLNFINSLTPTL
ncbi:Uncharacterized protein NEOC65_001855 [Neochlamydia sp. AcF65]|uniref:RhoGEF domain-containing protein n=1 Tax=Neochlamydia sp. AcF65 TaxID=2795735 RepID=UPI001BC9A467|nr:RhoGEF domain-containing protein [Neochlamydia sp. AcF65]MBS4166762.1 Uncharacterized protein [Neochlamydia sp. AcF65]